MIVATTTFFLDKPLANGGLDLSRYAASALLIASIVGCIFWLPQRAEKLPAPRISGAGD